MFNTQKKSLGIIDVICISQVKKLKLRKLRLHSLTQEEGKF